MNKNVRVKARNLIALISTIALLCSCTTMRPVAAGPDTPVDTIVQKVGVGDKVRVTTSRDVVHEFEVTRITNDALTGLPCAECDAVTIAMSDIEELRVKKISPLKTGASGTAIFLGVILAALLLSGGAGLLPPGL